MWPELVGDLAPFTPSIAMATEARGHHRGLGGSGRRLSVHLILVNSI